MVALYFVQRWLILKNSLNVWKVGSERQLCPNGISGLTAVMFFAVNLKRGPYCDFGCWRCPGPLSHHSGLEA